MEAVHVVLTYPPRPGPETITPHELIVVYDLTVGIGHKMQVLV
jgi:hypothetical protein